MKIKEEIKQEEQEAAKQYKLFCKLPESKHHIMRIQDPKAVAFADVKMYRKVKPESEEEEEVKVGGQLYDKTKVFTISLKFFR